MADMENTYKLSVIIPAFNAASHIEKLLDSIFQSSVLPYEVIVVDDCSTDNTAGLAQRENTRVIRLPENMGAAEARNQGADAANGDYLIFLDADVALHRDTIEKILDTFKAHTDMDVIIGMYSKASVNKGFAPEFKALFDYFIWVGKECHAREASSFEPRCAAMKKEVFTLAGGFNSRIKGATVEDFEFGYRLLEKGYKIFFNPEIQVGHHFPGFFQNIKNFYHRVGMWVSLVRNTSKKFDNVVTTKSHFIARASAALFYLTIPFWWSFPLPALAVAAFFLGVYLSNAYPFFVFLFKEKGFGFAVKGFFYDSLLSIVMCIAGFTSLIGWHKYEINK